MADLAGIAPGIVLTAGLDPNRDEGRAYAASLVNAGVPTTFLEAVGNIHAFVVLRKAIPSSQRDISSALSALKGVLALDAASGDDPSDATGS